MPTEVLPGARWLPFAIVSLANLPKGEVGGVYAIRSAATKEVLYIGAAPNLRRRLLGNYLGGAGGTSTRRIHELLFAEDLVADVEVAWLPADDHRGARSSLLGTYRAQNDGRLPPWNRLAGQS